MNITFYKKTILLFIISSVFIIPRPSQALWGFGDIALDPVQDASGIAQTVGQVTEIVNMVQGVLKEFGLDVVIYKLAQQASQKLIAKVLNHQTGGASGFDIEYNFVDNFQKHFTNINDQEFAKFTKYLDNDTSNPYSKYISRAMTERHANGGNPLSNFSLDKIQGVDWKQASTDISSAGINGWTFYSQLTEPVNTPIGSSMIAREQFASQVEDKIAVAKTELSSTGFKPDKGGKCTSSPDKYTENADSVTLDKPDCSSADVKTPSSIGQDQSAEATKESFERLRNSDELGKILMNTISQLVVGLIKKGFSSLNSDGGAEQKLYGGPKDISKLLNSQNSSWSSAPEQVVDLQADLDTAIIKTNLEISYINQAVESVKAPVVGTIDGVQGVAVKLEACIPGPDTNYETRLQDYAQAQTKDTQSKAGVDKKKGENNTTALAILTRQSKQGSEETKIILSNPFLNIPGALEMRSSLREFYKLSSSFHGLIDTVILKRQTLNSLQTIRAQVLAYGPGLTLFNSQWNILSDAAKAQLYNTVRNNLKTRLDGATLGTADPDDITNLAALESDLPEDNLDTEINERDEERKKRIFDAQWSDWETIMSEPAMETKKNQLYAQYISLGRDVSDSSTVQNTRLKTESAQHQAAELKKILDDCLLIRNYAAGGGSFPIPQGLISNLSTDRIRDVINGPSIFNAAQNGVDFTEANRRILDEQEDLPGGLDLGLANTLQVNLPTTPQELILQDVSQKLFCRLTLYHLEYWTPLTADPAEAALAGAPMGCAPGPNVGKLGSGGNRLVPFKKVEPNWYHTNAAEILFVMGDGSK